MFEQPDVWSNLEENCQVNFKELNKKQEHGTSSNKKRFVILPFLL